MVAQLIRDGRCQLGCVADLADIVRQIGQQIDEVIEFPPPSREKRRSVLQERLP